MFVLIHSHRSGLVNKYNFLMENWTAGVTEPPLYMLLMLQELLGLLPEIDGQ